MTPLTSVSYYSTLQQKFFKAALALLFFGMNSAAYAIFQGSAGEALLVPLVLYDANTSINTTISVTVPSRIGESLIPNEYTAPHTSPSDTSLPDTDVKIHWIFFNQNGVVMQDGYFLTMPNSIYTLDWKLIAPGQKGIPGYMLLQTEAGFHGEVADFNIFADAKFSMGSESTNIPVFPLADGTDATEPVSNCFIAGENEACTYTLFNSTSNPTHNFVSPLSSGIKTGDHANVTGETSFDLMLGRRTGTLSPLGLFARGLEPTLLVIWNDKNSYSYGAGYVYANNGYYCSGAIPLDKRLNLIWVLPTAYSLPPLIGIPGATYTGLCFPENTTAFPQPQYFRLSLPTIPSESSSIAFSLIMGSDMRMNLARERGQFQSFD